MKPIFFLLLSACVLLGLSSCEKVSGEGPVVTEVRSVTGFSGVDSRVSADVFITKGAVYAVEVRAQQNILNVLRTYESNGSLVIRFENDVRVRSHEPIQVFVTMPQLSRVRLSGSGDVKTTGDFQPGTMHLDISGSGNIEIAQLAAQAIDANISGSGNINVLSGTTQSAALKISGSGSLDLSGVQAQQTNPHQRFRLHPHQGIAEPRCHDLGQRLGVLPRQSRHQHEYFGFGKGVAVLIGRRYCGI